MVLAVGLVVVTMRYPWAVMSLVSAIYCLVLLWAAAMAALRRG